jgi:thiol-disulfide isomerase/thioredoxin
MTKGRILTLTLGATVLGIGALAIFAGSFGRGVAVGALGTIMLVAGLIWLVRRLMTKASTDGLEAPALPAALWDYEVVATGLDGEAIHFEQFRNRVTVINLWATWCAPCIAEMPSLFRLQGKVEEYDVAFTFLSQEDQETVRKFITKRGWSGPFHVASGEIPECFQTGAIPATFVVDRGGRIALRHFGAARWDDDSVVAFLRDPAAAPPD